MSSGTNSTITDRDFDVQYLSLTRHLKNLLKRSLSILPHLTSHPYPQLLTLPLIFRCVLIGKVLIFDFRSIYKKAFIIKVSVFFYSDRRINLLHYVAKNLAIKSTFIMLFRRKKTLTLLMP